MTAAGLTGSGPELLAHIGPLGHHDLWVIIPMAVLSALIMVVMARPKRAPAEPGDEQPEPGQHDWR